MQTTTARISETTEKLKADPAAGVTTPSVTATLLNGHARITSGPFNWESDLGPAIGGENLAPSPTAYLLGALAGCAVVLLCDTLAPQFEMTLEKVEATARCTSNTAGLLGLKGSNPRLADVELEVRVTSREPIDRLEALFAAWRERCPIYLALIDPTQVAVTFEVAPNPA
jgi:uncharacterized OsmC-like protein